MSRKPHPPAKPWVHLTGPEKPFDQTNGIVDFDADVRDDADPERDLIEKAVVINTIDVGGGF
jgi:hypothetical protein